MHPESELIDDASAECSDGLLLRLPQSGTIIHEHRRSTYLRCAFNRRDGGVPFGAHRPQAARRDHERGDFSAGREIDSYQGRIQPGIAVVVPIDRPGAADDQHGVGSVSGASLPDPINIPCLNG